MKKKAILSSILTIALCLSMIAGSSFALFTSKSDVNVAVTSGKVKVVATVGEIGYTSTLGNKLTESSATAEGNTITISKMVPGDTITFPITIHNESDVTVNYRTVFAMVEDTGLWEALVITVAESAPTEDAPAIMTLGLDDATATDAVATPAGTMLPGCADITLDVTITLPETAGNEYQEKGCSFAYTVEAIQGNVDLGEKEDATVSLSATALGAGSYTVKALQGNHLSTSAMWNVNRDYDSTVVFDGTNDVSADLYVGTFYLYDGTYYYRLDVTKGEDGEITTKLGTKILLINNLAELKAFRDAVNGGESFLHHTVGMAANTVPHNVFLCADIDLNNEEWTPIGTSVKPFMGDFDGQGHTISNLKITTGQNVGLFGQITMQGGVNYLPGIFNLTLNNVNIKAGDSGAFVGNSLVTTNNAGNGGNLVLSNLKLTGNVKIEGANVGGVMGTEWTNFQIYGQNITINANAGSYVKGTGRIGGVFASTPHGSISDITSNIDVIASGADVAAGGIVGCAGWTLTNVTCTGNVVATDVAATEDGQYMIGKIVGTEANNPYWGRYNNTTDKIGSTFAGFTANNTISITLTNGTVLTSNGMTVNGRHGQSNTVDYTQSLVGTAVWSWQF